MTTVEIRRLAGALGAEVTGVDLAALSDRDWATVHAAWLEHRVLFFPEQQLTPDDHVALGRRLGEPEIHPFIPKLDTKHQEIVVLDTTVGGKADLWHTDVTFSATPPQASILRMAVRPSVGGDTLFTNQYRAYEELSAPLKELVEGLSAVHTAAAYGKPEVRATHPVVRTHPETGRRSLFVNRTFTSHIVEMSGDESDGLLELLYKWSERPELQCRYRWTEGAIGMWDNRCTQHYALNDYTEHRVIQRVTVIGDAPDGEGPRWAAFANPTGSSREAIRTPI
jgi:taurine dioxygenase